MPYSMFCRSIEFTIITSSKIQLIEFECMHVVQHVPTRRVQRWSMTSPFCERLQERMDDVGLCGIEKYFFVELLHIESLWHKTINGIFRDSSLYRKYYTKLCIDVLLIDFIFIFHWEGCLVFARNSNEKKDPQARWKQLDPSDKPWQTAVPVPHCTHQLIPYMKSQAYKREKCSPRSVEHGLIARLATIICRDSDSVTENFWLFDWCVFSKWPQFKSRPTSCGSGLILERNMDVFDINSVAALPRRDLQVMTIFTFSASRDARQTVLTLCRVYHYSGPLQTAGHQSERQNHSIDW